jgi:hypothetical protein
MKYAAAVRADAIQIFVTNPRAWALPPVSAGQTSALREHAEAAGLPVFVHAPYLINLGSPDEVLRGRSASMLSYCLQRGADLGARGVVVHAGSAITPGRQDGLRRMREALLPVLDKLPDDGPDVLIEPMAGQGAVLCARIAEIGPYLAALEWHPRALLCLDTCHLFAAGHDLAAQDGVAAAKGPDRHRTVLGPIAPPGNRRGGVRSRDPGRREGPRQGRRDAQAAAPQPSQEMRQTHGQIPRAAERRRARPAARLAGLPP